MSKEVEDALKKSAIEAGEECVTSTAIKEAEETIIDATKEYYEAKQKEANQIEVNPIDTKQIDASQKGDRGDR